ncbi:MAG: hypothetical protein WCT42_00830 [Candidatus Paceibacterota bacterium]
MNEKQEQFKQLRDSRLDNERLLEDKKSLELKKGEMNKEDWELKARSIEIEILKTRGDIYKLEETLGLDKNDPEVKKIEEEAFTEINELEKDFEKVIVSESTEDKEFFEEIDELASCINKITDKVYQRGYSVETLENLRNSENINEKEFYNEIELDFEKFNGDSKIKNLKEKNSNLMLDLLILKIKDEYFKNYFLVDFSGDENIPHSKIVDIFIHNIPKNKDTRSYKDLEDSVNDRLTKEKRNALLNLPAEEVLDIVLDDPEILSSDLERNLSSKVSDLCQSYLNANNLNGVKRILEKILKIKENKDISITSFLPKINTSLNFNEEETIAIFSGEMPEWIFDRYCDSIICSPFISLVPEKYIKEKYFHGEIIVVFPLTKESIKQGLDKNGLIFSDLSPEEKIICLEKGEDNMIDIFSVDDLKQILSFGKYIDIDKIPKKYQTELKYDIIDNLFNNRNLDHLEILKKVSKELNLNFKDLSDEKNISILNKINYSSDIVSLFDPQNLKRLILREDSEFESSYGLENLLNITGLTVSDFSEAKQIKIFYKVRWSVNKIKNIFSIDDLRKIVINKDINLDFDNIPNEYIDGLSNEIIEMLRRKGDLSFEKNKVTREWFFEKLKERIEKDDNFEIEKDRYKNLKRINRIQESFWLLDSQEKLPPQIIEKFNIFKEKYGKKGEGLISLSIVAHGLENINQTVIEIEKMEQVIDLYDKENIPEGMRGTYGFEYEVGTEHGKLYDEESILGYAIEAELIGRSSNIKRGGGGSGSIYEHSTTPTDNPYIVMVEMDLLQKARMIDPNAKEFPGSSRGYHLNLGGENGLTLSENMYFFENTMYLTGLNSLKTGMEVSSIKNIHQKLLDKVFEKKQGGDRVEIKSMGFDCVEQFNRAILSAHNTVIAVQLAEKYQLNPSFEILEKLPNNIEDFDSFLLSINDFEEKIFDSEQEKQIVYAWLKFKKETFLAIKQHNNSFVQSEFEGSFFNEKGEYVETTENIDLKGNNQTIKDLGINLNSGEFKKIYQIPEDCLNSETYTKELSNSLTRVNNIFIFKEPVLSEGKFSVNPITKQRQLKPEQIANAYAFLTGMRGEGYIKDIPGSPFDSIIDTGGKIRDGYYYVQKASEEMITHKSQIILNRFNKEMEELLTNSVEEDANKQKQYERAI